MLLASDRPHRSPFAIIGCKHSVYLSSLLSDCANVMEGEEGQVIGARRRLVEWEVRECCLNEGDKHNSLEYHITDFQLKLQCGTCFMSIYATYQCSAPYSLILVLQFFPKMKCLIFARVPIVDSPCGLPPLPSSLKSLCCSPTARRKCKANRGGKVATMSPSGRATPTDHYTANGENHRRVETLLLLLLLLDPCPYMKGCRCTIQVSSALFSANIEEENIIIKAD